MVTVDRPLALLSVLRSTRDGLRRLESRARTRLPAWCGGRYPTSMLNMRRLGGVHGPTDAAAYTELRFREGMSVNRGSLIADFDAPARFCVGAFRGDALLGAGWCVSALAEPGFLHTSMMSDLVDRRHRRRGVHQALIRERLKLLRACGGQRSFAWVAPLNAASMASFVALGFAPAQRSDLPPGIENPHEDYVPVEFRLGAAPGG